VTGLTWDTEEDELKEHFSQAGTVILATVIRQRRNGKAKASMGCGIVEFDTIEAAENSIAIMNETELKGRNIRVREDRIPEDEEVTAEQTVERTSPDVVDGENRPKTSSRSRSSRKESAPKKIDLNDANIVPELCKIFITSLMPTVTNDDLVEYFGTIGAVASAEILSTRKGRSICSGIVTFEDDASVDSSIAQLSNIDFKGRVIVVRKYFV
jgi:RNA recognition motif-containing protein